LLHDTYGFPVEVTAEVTAERGHGIDMAGFEADMADQRRRAKQARKFESQADDMQAIQALVSSEGGTSFVGRSELTDVEATVMLVTGDTDQGGPVSVFLDQSPFYAEAGGQIGDTGTIKSPTGSGTVVDTVYAVPGVHRHLVQITEGEITAGQTVTASVDVGRRSAIVRNHTGTHLLHWALRQVLGDHVQQQGSMVGPDRLRFDFSHFDPLTPEQIKTIEDLANSEVLKNSPASHVEVTKAEAEAMGAIAFFGDKYGDMVRVLTAGPSLEFCGGTHVNALGDIGLIKIVSEGSIGSNLRRVEAVTGTGAIELLRSEQAMVDQAASTINVPRGDLVDGVAKRVAEIKDLKAEIKAMRSQLAAGQADRLADSAVGGVVIARVDGLGPNDLKELAVTVRSHLDVNAVVLGGSPGSGAALVAAVTPNSGLNAGNLLSDAAKAIRGGGGKGPEIAVAGGKDANGVDEALALAAIAAGVEATS